MTYRYYCKIITSAFHKYQFFFNLFLIGKDLSSRSETDLACIFGKRAKQMRNQDEVR